MTTLECFSILSSIGSWLAGIAAFFMALVTLKRPLKKQPPILKKQSSSRGLQVQVSLRAPFPQLFLLAGLYKKANSCCEVLV